MLLEMRHLAGGWPDLPPVDPGPEGQGSRQEWLHRCGRDAIVRGRLESHELIDPDLEHGNSAIIDEGVVLAPERRVDFVLVRLEQDCGRALSVRNLVRYSGAPVSTARLLLIAEGRYAPARVTM